MNDRFIPLEKKQFFKREDHLLINQIDNQPFHCTIIEVNWDYMVREFLYRVRVSEHNPFGDKIIWLQQGINPKYKVELI